MQFTVIGSGAIGGTVGAHLVRAGDDVRFIDRDPTHVAAMQARGLTIRGPEESFTVPVDATSPDAASGPLGAVLLCVKSQDTRAAAEWCRPRLRPGDSITSLQNGLCERVIAEVVGEAQTIGAFVNFSADLVAPGTIDYGGPGTFVVGELDGRLSSRVQALGERLRVFLPITVSPNVLGYLWAKLGYANMLFATALVDATMADVIERYPDLMVELACEVYDVAARVGVRLEPFDDVEPHLYHPRERQDPEQLRAAIATLVARRRRDGKTKSGIWRDLAVRHRRTEVDFQPGAVVEEAVRFGLPLPLTERVIAQIHDLEEGRRAMAWQNLVELERLRTGRPPPGSGSGGSAAEAEEPPALPADPAPVRPPRSHG
ncbi:MAG TPA: 2-dehydropantoate 2-reductase [Verrucomicrobiae bacterium]|nr:2-dehydropantoate 2-reductase [Verrucomicrobiae bacterium]